MDGAVKLDPAEIAGRNMWLVWSGGNDRFWDSMSGYTFGAFDLLKVVSTHPSLGYTRDSRWSYFGLVNEPCFEARRRPTRTGAASGSTSAPRAAPPIRSRTRASTPASPSARAASRSATARRSRSARSTATPSGIVGLRLFPKPAFDEKAAKAWIPERYYTDPSYYNRATWSPVRVGMSCGFCHVGPEPVNPPADPAHPAYANLSSSVGAQYMWGRPALHLQLEQARGPQELHVPARPLRTGPAAWTRRWSRPTASTIRAR
jgi:hypothetical protein